MENRRFPLRHNFAIRDLGKRPGLFQGHRYLYYCVHCKWAFLINDTSRAAVTPVDAAGKPLESGESRRRLGTFVQGPCPATAIFRTADTGVGPQASQSMLARLARRADANGEASPKLQLVQARAHRRAESGTR
jgi:hypothetical protein